MLLRFMTRAAVWPDDGVCLLKRYDYHWYGQGMPRAGCGPLLKIGLHLVLIL